MPSASVSMAFATRTLDSATPFAISWIELANSRLRSV